MSPDAILEGISTELRRQAFDTLAETPDTDFSSMDPGSNIALASPGEDFACQFVVTLSLCHIDACKPLRNLPLLRTSAAELHQPPLPLQRRHLITPLDTDTNHYLMLGRVLQHSHDYPISARLPVPPRLFAGGASDRIRVSHAPSPRNNSPSSGG